MGSRVSTPDERTDETAGSEVSRVGLGDLLAGRLADVTVDSVDAVRDVRDSE
ncbi:MAG: hypothetical protein ABEH78_05040 [Haloferacaceae archaeon]